MFVNVILIVLVSGLVKAQVINDPLCEGKACSRLTSCRVFVECTSSNECSLNARCVEEVSGSHTGVCQGGDPILVDHGSYIADRMCGPGSECPESTYCNTDLQDTYATCCRSALTNTVKPGVCPVYSYDGFYCVDMCNNDGDCHYDGKCCQQGCRKECSNPVYV